MSNGEILSCYNIRAEKELPSFVKKLKSSFYPRLSKVFNQDDILSFTIVCVKRRRFNAHNSCTCWSTGFFLLFSLVNDYIFCYFSTWGLVRGLGFNFVCL